MSAEPPSWKYVHFGLVVTGEGERDFLPGLFRELAATKHANFFVLRQTGQRTQLSQGRIEDYLKQGKQVPDRDADIALVIRRHVADADRYALWIDDLESDSRANAQPKLERLTRALDVVIGKWPSLRERCSAHCLVNMVEAYYFLHADAVTSVLKVDFKEHDGDCENLRHPKNELKRLAGRGNFDEKEHGGQIVGRLDLDRILADPARCRALRTLVAWCWEAIGEPRGERFRLSDGVYWDVTAPQLRIPPPAGQIGPLAAEEPYRPMA